MRLKNMRWEKFAKTYKPIKNKVRGASIDGYMYETFGDELKDLLAKANRYAKTENGKNGYHIWTLVDGEGNTLILENGWHLVNRLGYIITEVPWLEGEMIEVRV